MFVLAKFDLWWRSFEPVHFAFHEELSVGVHERGDSASQSLGWGFLWLLSLGSYFLPCTRYHTPVKSGWGGEGASACAWDSFWDYLHDNRRVKDSTDVNVKKAEGLQAALFPVRQLRSTPYATVGYLVRDPKCHFPSSQTEIRGPVSDNRH
jgi:hypothetical protein